MEVELFPLLVVLLINLVENSVENRKKFEISFILSLFAESDVKQVSKTATTLLPQNICTIKFG
jgi:hypothetical protein